MTDQKGIGAACGDAKGGSEGRMKSELVDAMLEKDVLFMILLVHTASHIR